MTSGMPPKPKKPLSPDNIKSPSKLVLVLVPIAIATITLVILAIYWIIV